MYGAPLEGVRVYALSVLGSFESGYDVSNANGEYLLTGLNPADYYLRFMPASGSEFVASYWAGNTKLTSSAIHVSKDDTQSGVNQHLKPGSLVSGEITDPNNNAVPFAQVTAVSTSGQSFSTTASNQGIYALPAMPAGQYRFYFAGPKGTTLSPTWDYNAAERGAMTFNLNTSSNVGLNWSLAAGAVISGKIAKNKAGAGLPGAILTAYSLENENVMFQAVADSTGNFTIVNAIPGNYKILVEGPAGSSDWQRAWVGGTSFEGATPFAVSSGGMSLSATLLKKAATKPLIGVPVLTPTWDGNLSSVAIAAPASTDPILGYRVITTFTDLSTKEVFLPGSTGVEYHSTLTGQSYLISVTAVTKSQESKPVTAAVNYSSDISAPVLTAPVITKNSVIFHAVNSGVGDDSSWFFELRGPGYSKSIVRGHELNDIDVQFTGLKKNTAYTLYARTDDSGGAHSQIGVIQITTARN